MPANPATQVEQPPALHLEMIVDRRGQPHQPLVVSGGAHPVVVYGALESLRTMPHFAPARDSGEPVDSLFKYSISLRASRWNQGGKLFTGKID